MELAQVLGNYGLAGGFAVMFWRYITTVQKQQTKTLQQIDNSLERLHEKVE